MKPCSNNRKAIAWLAMGGANAAEEKGLRAHLECCAGCRAYFQEVKDLTQKLEAVDLHSDIHASAGFHQGLVRRLRAEASSPIWELLTAQMQLGWLNWRIALPVSGAVAAVIAIGFFATHRPAVLPLGQYKNQAASTLKHTEDVEPTMSNYRMIANRSLEKLDEELSREATRSPAPSPIYTASTLTRAYELE